jgi:hypothetical protein
VTVRPATLQDAGVRVRRSPDDRGDIHNHPRDAPPPPQSLRALRAACFAPGAGAADRAPFFALRRVECRAAKAGADCGGGSALNNAATRGGQARKTCSQIV